MELVPITAISVIRTSSRNKLVCGNPKNLHIASSTHAHETSIYWAQQLVNVSAKFELRMDVISDSWCSKVALNSKRLGITQYKLFQQISSQFEAVDRDGSYSRRTSSVLGIRQAR